VAWFDGGDTRSNYSDCVAVYRTVTVDAVTGTDVWVSGIDSDHHVLTNAASDETLSALFDGYALAVAFLRMRLRQPSIRNYAVTKEPSFSPCTTRTMLPRSRMLKMIIGRLLSLHSDTAVVSMTLRPRFRISM